MTAMSASPAVPSRTAHPLLVLLAILGIVAFLYGVLQGSAPRAWGIYLVNLLFWSSLAITGPALAAMIQVTEGRWSPSVKRIALTTAGFLPVSFVLFLVLFLGPRDALSLGERAHRRSRPRGSTCRSWRCVSGSGVLLLYWVAMRLVKAVLVEDQPGGDAPAAVNRRNRLAGWLLFLYVVVLSLWGFDLLMSLDPRWYSGLFGGYYVVTSMYTGFGLVTFLTIRSNERGLSRVPPPAIQDVAKLTFALCVFWMYFFFSQYLVIWYGHVPAETRFVIRRFFVQPWGTIAWAIFIVGWLIPFSYLLKRLTGRPPGSAPGVQGHPVLRLDRHLLRADAARVPLGLRDNTVPLGPVEILVTLGFFSLFVLSRNWFLAHYKPVLRLPSSRPVARSRPRGKISGVISVEEALERILSRVSVLSDERRPAHRGPPPCARGGRGQPARHAAVAGLLDGRLRPPQRRHGRCGGRAPRAACAWRVGCPPARWRTGRCGRARPSGSSPARRCPRVRTRSFRRRT